MNTKEQLQEIIAKAQEALADLEKPKSYVWKPKKHQECYCLLADGVAMHTIFGIVKIDNRFVQGNLFETREQAEKESRKRAAIKRINDAITEANEGWKPDWTQDTNKYYPNFAHNAETWEINYSWRLQVQFTFIHCKSKQALKAILQSHTKDFEKLL